VEASYDKKHDANYPGVGEYFEKGVKVVFFTFSMGGGKKDHNLKGGRGKIIEFCDVRSCRKEGEKRGSGRCFSAGRDGFLEWTQKKLIAVGVNVAPLGE